MSVLFDKLSIFLADLAQGGPRDSRRIFHGRGRCFPGLEFLTIDYYQPVLLVVFYKEPPPDFLPLLVEFLYDKLSASLSCVLLQRRYITSAPSDVLLGQMPEQVFAQRGPLRFNLHLNAQQNAGFFLDMESGRQWVEQHAQGKRILNLFAYSCAFSVVAAAAGAKVVVNVDMSSSALNLGRANHQLNGLPRESNEYLAENIMKSWGRIKRKGPFDMVIIDPPSYQKGSFVAEKDYARVVRRLPELMPNGGLVLACLNAPELSEDFLQHEFAVHLPQAVFVTRIPVHPDFPDINPSQQLKLMVYQLPVAQQTQPGHI